MPKGKESVKSFLERMVKENEGQFSTDGQVLFCLMCDKNVPATQISQVKQHLCSSKHSKSVTRKTDTKQPQKNQLLLPAMKKDDVVDRNANMFAMDLTQCFIETNIPLNVIRDKSMVKFLEKYTKYGVPSESTLRTKYIPQIYEECVNKMKEKAKNNFLWVSLDESTDSEERYVVNFIFGILGVESERGKCYLFTSKVLEKANGETMARFFDECVNELSK